MNARPAALLTVVLAGCPLPQPLPDYPANQPITPPRVVALSRAFDETISQVAFPATVVEVPAGCAVAPVYPLTAPLRDANTTETVVARWFVNYDTRSSSSVSPEQAEEIPAPPDTAADPTVRQTSTFTFLPYDYTSVAGTGGVTGATVGALNVVELVVSNSFDPAFDTNQATLPYRMPTQNFEVQLHRWVFLTVSPSADAPCP